MRDFREPTAGGHWTRGWKHDRAAAGNGAPREVKQVSAALSAGNQAGGRPAVTTKENHGMKSSQLNKAIANAFALAAILYGNQGREFWVLVIWAVLHLALSWMCLGLEKSEASTESRRVLAAAVAAAAGTEEG